MRKIFGIYTEEGQHVMAQRGKRIAPVTFEVIELDSLPPQMHSAFVNRRYRNIAQVYGLEPESHVCKEIKQ